MDFRANDGTLDPAEVEVRQLAGRDHLVAPTVLVKEGDLNGGYMPASELEASAPGWNGVPVTVDHPKENGEFVSANQTEFIEEMGIGHVYNVEYDDELRGLRGEMWVDIDRARELDGEARQTAEQLAYHTESVESNAETGLLEVSTGYFHNEAQTSHGLTQTDLLPDHLAALPNDTGKCSVEDGCGAPRATANVRSSARTPDYSGTEAAEWSAPTLEDYVSGLDLGDVSSVDDLSADDKSLIAGKTLLGDANADSFDDLSFFPVVNPSSNSLNENALDAVLGGRGAQADIPDDAESSAQSTARGLLSDEFDRDVEGNAQSESFVTRLSKAIAGAFAAPDAPNPDDVTANATETSTSDTDMNDDDYERLSSASGIDVDTLRQMDEQTLSVIERGANADDENGDDETDPDEEPADDDTPGEETDPLEALTANCDDGESGMEVLVDKLADRLGDQMTANVTEQVQSELEAQSERQQKEAFIAANSSYDIDSLTDYGDGEIDRLAEFVEREHQQTARPNTGKRVGANYVGRGAPSDDDDDDEDRASVLSAYNKALGQEDDD